LPESPALVCDRGIVVQANLAAVRLAGRWRPDSLTGLPLQRLLTGSGTDAELIGPDGYAVPVRVTRWTVPDTNLLVVFLVDVSDLRPATWVPSTERRLAEVKRVDLEPVNIGEPRANAELAQERARLLEAQRIARIGSFTWEWCTNEISYSPALVELFDGRCIDPSDPLRHVHPEDLPNLMRRMQEMISDPGVGTLEAEFRGLPEYGETRYMCRLRAQRSGGGEILRLMGTVQDVTQARALERELREEQRRLAEAQRVARIGTWEWEPGCDRLVWSDMMQDLYGVASAPRQATYQTYLSLVHPDDREWVDELWRQLVIDHMPVECEHRVLRPDGAVRTFRCHGAAITDPSGSRRLVGTVQDVTEQRAAETRMIRSSQRFADLVAIAPVGIGIFDDADR
ncbi:MAG: PAS domain-containing protein, partial [Actinomycetes bacterium]